MQQAATVRKKRHLASFQIIILGFAGLILVGTLILALPVSSRAGCFTPIPDAMFTATSAVCVTGLVVYDTAIYWSDFGQAVILVLIQIGGLGVVLFGISLAVLFGRKITLMQRSTVQEAISAPRVGGIVRLTRFILIVTLLFEVAGALLLMPVFCRDHGLHGVWMAFFHAISAFCNAGFDITGTGAAPFASLSGYAADPLCNLCVVFLIVIGGIGFLTWDDFYRNRFRFRRYRLQSKLVLVATLVLIVLPTSYFFLFEFRDMPLEQRFFNSLFMAVTPRTAGFSTVEISSMSGAGRSILTGLMLIGGSPGSTAGGMKTATVAVLVISALSVFRRRENPECFGRRIDNGTVKRASAVLIMYLVLFFTGALILNAADQIPMSAGLFETASAIGTVGLTTGITPQLGTVSKYTLMVLMLFGRAGGLTMIYAAFFKKTDTFGSRLPQESITLG